MAGWYGDETLLTVYAYLRPALKKAKPPDKK